MCNACNGKLARGTPRFIAAFASLQVIPSAWLRLFNPKEVNELLSGGEGGGLDAADMQRHATYSGGYTSDSQTIKIFWKVTRCLPVADMCTGLHRREGARAEQGLV